VVAVPGRRPPSRASAAFGFALTLALVLPAASFAGGFKDRTPLPSAISNGATTTTQSGGAAGSGAFIRMIVGLAIVLAVIYGVYWLLKTYGKSKKQQGDGRMEVVATTVLASNRTVHLVRVGEELILVGSAEQSITPLRVYDAEQTRRLEPFLDGQSPLRPLPSNGRSRGPGLMRVLDDLRRRSIRG
jgi:flagellar protein FliO/FliZ